MIRYKIELKNTDATIGYFQPEPQGIEFIEQGLELLKENTFDDFLRNYILFLFSNLTKQDKQNFIKKCYETDNSAIKAFGAEAQMIFKKDLTDTFSFPDDIYKYSSLIYLKSQKLIDQNQHFQLNKVILKNIKQHLLPQKKLPEVNLEANKLSIKYSMEKDSSLKKQPQESDPNFFNHVLDRFEKAQIIPGSEMRHMNALSPHNILRKWYMKTNIKTNEANFSFEGIQTSYGKGFTLEQARLTCLMEMTERISSFVSVEDLTITTRKKDQEIIKTSYSQGLKQGLNLLNPNDLRLETKYEDEELFFMKAKTAKNSQDIYIPVQMVYLFCNLPEISLFSSLDSTGLASGDTQERAKLSGLFEAVERDCEYSTPFTIGSCFRIKSKSNEVNELLDFYRSNQIEFFFQNITGEMGIPTYKAFVYGRDNQIYKGCCTHLNSKKAVIDALFEVPYPIAGFPSKKIEYDLPEIFIEDLPDFSSDNIETDLKIMERIFEKNNINIIYADITRPDIDIPVFKTIVPGFEINGDFDQYSRISQRQYNKFKEIF